jgi:hypothetical protein
MGNPAGGAIANTYMLDWDKIIMNHHIHKIHLQLYLRYFDDGFIIWNGTETQLISFLAFINSIDKHIKTTSCYGKSAVYLDTNISIDSHNTIRTRTNRKSTATDSYLDYTSAHPKHLKDNLQTSILFRSFIICNTQYQYKLEQQQILQRFKNSNYTKRTLEEAVKKTSTKYNIPSTDNQQQYSQSRREAIMNIGTKNHKNHDQESNQRKIYLPVTYWPRLPYNKQFNKTTWPQKLNNCKIKNLLPTISYKQPPNLLRLLTNTKT